MHLFFMSVATAVASLILPGPREGLTASAWRQGLAVGAWELGIGLRCLHSGTGSSPNQAYQSDPFSLCLKYLSGLFVFFFPRPLELWKSFPAPSPGARISYHGDLLWGRAAAGDWVLPPGAQLVPGTVGDVEVAPPRKQRGFTGPVSRFQGNARIRLQCQGPRADEDRLTRWTLTGWGCDARGSPTEQDHASLCFRSLLCTHPLPINDTPSPHPEEVRKCDGKVSILLSRLEAGGIWAGWPLLPSEPIRATEEVPAPSNMCSTKTVNCRTSLVVQGLRLCTSTAGSMGSIPSWGTEIPRACPAAGGKKRWGLELFQGCCLVQYLSWAKHWSN